ncbi:ankyrin [Legionella norrlandica]|uniref:Ankyrin n=1 Tax=Legionella norrlandica TaxID=1498499 RepID=A0A0A2SVB4_9GAMM|nr:Dot/Icm T4SS effector AnkK/LegA5 [Legionella norrlandica]KGP63676.1 ankyrin [Legionella norrlandica]
MSKIYNINDIYLGAPSFSGHEVYLNAIHYPSSNTQNSLRVIYKKNKHSNPNLSRMEVAFSQLAKLFMDRGLTSFQKLVINDDKKIEGLVVQHLNYVINNKEGLEQPFFVLNNPKTGCQCAEKKVDTLDNIPFYFLDKLPQQFFNKLLAAEKNNELSIDYASLASILASSYTLEEDDLHKGNFGFYLIKKNGKPHVVFFKIDHDLMFVDSIMSFCTRRFFHLFSDRSAFDITAKDLLNFPNLIDSANSYWPTKTSIFFKPWANKDYRSYAEIRAFANLAQVDEFNKAKWRAFYKHILISQSLMETTLKDCFNENDPSDRAHIALVTHAALTRQSRLRAMLFSLKEFRDFVHSLSDTDHDSLCNDIIDNLPEEDRAFFKKEISQSLADNQKILQSNVVEDGDTPLHIAIKLGDYRYDETISMYGQFTNTKNRSGKTPLDIALQMVEKTEIHFAADICKDLRFTMKHLLANGAHKTKQFREFNKTERIEFYEFKTLHLNKARKAENYFELQKVLGDIGENHSFCLKFKKKLAVHCISEFINTNQNNPNLRGILIKLKKAVDGKGARFENAPLMYIRQLRSRLWIVRQIRGLYGWSTTQGEIDSLIDKELMRLNIDKKFNSFFECVDKSSFEEQPLDDLLLVR